MSSEYAASNERNGELMDNREEVIKRQCPLNATMDCSEGVCAWWVSEYKWRRANGPGEKDTKQDTSGCAVPKLAERLRGWKISSL